MAKKKGNGHRAGCECVFCKPEGNRYGVKPEKKERVEQPKKARRWFEFWK